MTGDHEVDSQVDVGAGVRPGGHLALELRVDVPVEAALLREHVVPAEPGEELVPGGVATVVALVRRVVVLDARAPVASRGALGPRLGALASS